MPRNIRIITRESRLALWQTNAVTTRVEHLGGTCTIVTVKSTGDIDLVNPIYEIGVQGVFTKELDSALLADQADAAVHSLKDIPTTLAKGLLIAAVMERGPHEDVLFVKPGFLPSTMNRAVVATSSIRRKAQWLERFGQHVIVNVRGNIDTRLKKFWESDWNAIIMAKAGVDRLGIDIKNAVILSWMLPSPAQGAIAVVCREEDAKTIKLLRELHHEPTYRCVMIERDFLKHLQGGCSAPISALAQIENDFVHFMGAVHRPDGTKTARIEKDYHEAQWREVGKLAAGEIMASEVGKMVTANIQELRKEK